MEVFPISILNFSKFPQDGNSVLIPGKLFMANRKPAPVYDDGSASEEETVRYDGRVLTMDYPVQLKGMTFALTCTGGKATIKINLSEHVLTRGCVCVLVPETFFQIVDASEDFTGVAIAMVRDFFDYTNNVNMTMKVLTRIIESPISHLPDHELEEFVELSDMMIRKLGDENFAYREEVAKAYLTLMKYSALQSQTEELKNSVPPQSGNRRGEIYNKFISAVEQYYKEERNVMFYADKLCISPKYLSSVIHDVSGKYATDWINGYVILEAKVLLRKNDMTIKEICSKLNFSNQSFFAKYFKQHTGMTPKEFRNKA